MTMQENVSDSMDLVSVSDKLGRLPDSHADVALMVQFQDLLTDLYMYSEAKYLYEVFLWDIELHGELSN